MSFKEKLLSVVESQNSLLCVGLDTDIERIPDHIKSEPDPVLAFNREIIEATAKYATAFKLNTAFYEARGIEGWQTLQETLDAIPPYCLTIADAKRGDIGNTSRMYAKSLFEVLGADAITVNPYMGHDSVRPFLEDPEKGVFILCVTSNPGSQDFQRISDGQSPLYKKIALTVQEWNDKNNCGLVVGATQPQELAEVRSWVPEMPFLIPGIGAQGGDIEQAVRNGTDHRGSNALFNSSRAILYASSGPEFASAAASVASKTRDELNRYRK